MVKLGKITPKRMFQTSDGKKFEIFEEAQKHSKILQFREMIGLTKINHEES